MPESIVPPIETPVDPAAELATLRQAHAEVLAKRKKDKEALASLEGRLTQASATIHELTINGPMKTMAASLSTAPEAFQDAFQRDYKLEMQNGVLTLLNAGDSSPVIHDGKPVPFERDAIQALLLSTKDEAKQRLYKAIVITNRASGSGNPVAGTGQRAVTKKPAHQFGLR